MIAPTPFFADRGCHVRIYEEARHLQNTGHSILICSYPIGREMPEINTTRIVNPLNYQKLEAGPSWHKIYLDLLLFFRILGSVRKFQPDIIYAHLHEGAFLGHFAKFFRPVPLIFDYQGSLTGEIVDHNFIEKGSWKFRLFSWLENKIECWSDAIITSSKESARQLQQKWSKKRIFPLIDGVDTNIFKANLETIDLKKSLNLPENKVVIVFLGLLNRYQGIDLLLESIQIILEKTDKLHFLIMGYPNVEYYQNVSEKLEISAYITFTGRISYQRAAEYLNLADIAISPKISKTESNGKLLNYMACGLPTITFDTPINREVLAEDGVYAEFKNPRSFAEKVILLAEAPSKRKELSQKLRERATSKFSWETQIRNLDDFLYSITKESQKNNV